MQNDSAAVPHADILDAMTKMSAEELVGEEWAEWYSLTPMERFRESEKLWETYLSLGGSLDPEPDTQSPFFNRSTYEPSEANREI